MRNKGEKFEWNNEAQVAFENIKRKLCEAPVLGMPTEKGMYVLDTDALVVAISGILHQEQEWKGRTVLRPIAYGSKVLSDTEMKYGAPKAEMFAVVIFVEKYRAYLGSAPFKLRVGNRALSWLKTYSMDQSYIGRWIVRLDGYHRIFSFGFHVIYAFTIYILNRDTGLLWIRRHFVQPFQDTQIRQVLFI